MMMMKMISTMREIERNVVYELTRGDVADAALEMEMLNQINNGWDPTSLPTRDELQFEPKTNCYYAKIRYIKCQSKVT